MKSVDPGEGLACAGTTVIDGAEQSLGFDSLGIERIVTRPCP
ncbi:MAG: hypothetical protein V3U86_08725 [Acidobacteriota bacterium]|nr:hypothetical protein [Acidobacteriota bacterium]